MQRLTLCLLLDAFRPDYLQHAPFLRDLAAGAPARLREPFGFLPRAAYFGGLTPEQYGFANMYVRDPARSPFGTARGIDAALGAYDRALGIRAFIDEAARSRVSAFAQSYVSSACIPLHLLPEFDLAEQTAPWAPQPGYRSLFCELAAVGQSWFECSWPGTNRLADPSDRGIVAAALDRATGRERFGYVHLQALDGCGHRFGPGSPELRDAVRVIDALAADLVEGLRRKFDGIDLLVFGDHGMVAVTRTIDLAAVLRALPCRAPSDFCYFLDSTMARFWFSSSRARRIVLDALSSVDGGRVLTPNDLVSFHIARCDARNGEAYFLAEPGVVIHPCFFQRQDDEPPRGMHGYDPDCGDNLGVLILHSDTLDPPAGTVDATALYDLMRQMTGLARPARWQPRARPSANRPRFTRLEETAADAAVAAQLDAITAAMLNEIGEPRAIVLTGSFGRGEGSVFRDGDRWQPVNDYDILVVDRADCSAALRRLSSDLPARLGIDFLDLAWADGCWRDRPATMANFDLKYGSLVLRGDRTVLDGLPSYATAEVPLIEGIQLLFNRTAGLLSGMGGVPRAAVDNEAAHRYLINQYVKAAIAVGDAYLLQWRGYDSSYATRRRRFLELARGAGVDSRAACRVADAYSRKLAPDYRAFANVIVDVRALAPMLTCRISELIAAGTPGLPELALIDALDAYCAYRLIDDPAADNFRLMRHPAVAAIVNPAAIGGSISVRQTLYATLPLLLQAATAHDAPACRPSEWPHADRLLIPPVVNGWDEWDAIRRRAVDAWFAMIH